LPPFENLINYSMKKILFIGIVTTFCSFAMSQSSIYIDPKLPVGYRSTEEAMITAGLEKYQTPDNIKLISEISENDQALRRIVGANFAGMWIEYDKKSNANLVVAIAGSDKLDTRGIGISRDRVKVRRVTFNMVQLKENLEIISSIFMRQPSKTGEFLVFSIAIDEINNRVVVRGRENNKEKILDSIAAIGVDMSAIAFEGQEGPFFLW